MHTVSDMGHGDMDDFAIFMIHVNLEESGLLPIKYLIVTVTHTA